MKKENKQGKEEKKIIDRLPPSQRLRDQKWFWPVTIGVVLLTIGMIVLFAWLGSSSSTTPADSAVFADFLN